MKKDQWKRLSDLDEIHMKLHCGVELIRQRKAEKGQKYATETSRSIGRG